MRARGRGHEMLIALFLLGALLLVPPLLLVFNRPERLLGLPSLYLYLFAAWTALIALIALAVERLPAADENEEGDSGSATDRRGTTDA